MSRITCPACGAKQLPMLTELEIVTINDGDLLHCERCDAEVPVYGRSQDFLCHRGHYVPIPDDLQVSVLTRRFLPGAVDD